MIIRSLATVRALALQAQGLTLQNSAEPKPTRDALEAVVEQIGCLQIDTLQVVRRSQYLVLWSRLGDYDPSDLDRLLDDPADRRLFEGWQHAACIIPLAEYRYQMPHQRFLRAHPAGMTEKWLNEPGNREVLKSVLERIRRQGAVRATDFESDGQKRAGWWDWKPAKNALEHLYAWGDLMIARRVDFQRVYDLTERVLLDWVDTSEPSPEERDRFWIERGARALAIFTPQQSADYTWMKASRARPHIEQLTREGILVPVQARLVDGKVHNLVVHRQNLPLLDQAASGEIRPARTTFLSPFDNLFWARGRDVKFWGFRQRLEAYTPAPKRVWGYFCLPVLHKDRLVGRFDPKLDRRNNGLYLKALYLEPGIRPDDELIADVSDAMRSFMSFHNAGELVIENSHPKGFARKLVNAL